MLCYALWGCDKLRFAVLGSARLYGVVFGCVKLCYAVVCCGMVC